MLGAEKFGNCKDKKRVVGFTTNTDNWNICCNVSFVSSLKYKEFVDTAQVEYSFLS